MILKLQKLQSLLGLQMGLRHSGSGIFLLVMSLVLPACLQTRSEVEDRRKMQIQVEGLQENRANEVSKIQDIEGQMREMSGRIDELSHQLVIERKSNGELKGDVSELRVALEDRLKLYLEEIEKYEVRLESLEAKIIRLQEVQKKRVRKKNTKSQAKAASKVGFYTQGNGFFKQKKWKEAISAYQVYRKKNPKGRRYAEATYKIGVAFQELKLFSEAKVFFEVVVDRYASTNSAKKSKYRLDRLKKK